jgi:LacI family transcriptional regulator
MPSSVNHQIATALNVSGASVSRALNDKPGVGMELRQRILDKARELNYAPRVTARGLATARTFSLGFFVREKPGLAAQTDPFYGEILHGVEQASARSAYHVTIATLTADILNRPAGFRFVREGRVDGMILAGPDIPSGFVIAMLHTGLPVVLVDNTLDYQLVNCVLSDDIGGGRMAAEHLLGLGHQHIGILAGPEEWPSNARRVHGYRQVLDRAGLPAHIIHMDCTTIDSGAEAYALLMEQHPEITALGAVNDSMAIGAIQAAQAAGRHVPDDLSVIGFDNIEWARLNRPPLTTIDVLKHQMGKEAANRLLTLLDDSVLLPTEVSVAVRLVERSSCRARHAS